MSAICTDGAPTMVGRNMGFVGHLIRAGIQTLTFHCVIHQQALFSKIIGFEDIMKTAVKIINQLRMGHNALTHRKLIDFLKEMESDYNNILLLLKLDG